MAEPTRTAAVIGGGTMGAGIGYVLAVSGWRTVVVEADPARAAALPGELAQRVRTGIERGRLDAARADVLDATFAVTGAVEDLPTGLDLLVESVPERTELKVDVLRAAEAREPLLLATNTSSLSIDSLAAGLERPDRFLGLHFFNPVWSIDLVEVVRGRATSQAYVDRAVAIATSLDKEAIVVRDVPGFATSRLDNVAALEAMRMLEEGVTDAASIDRAAVVAYGHPIGPLRLSDVVGLDVRLDIARHLSTVYGERYAPPRILEEMVARGDLGRKSGRGFFDWGR